MGRRWGSQNNLLQPRRREAELLQAPANLNQWVPTLPRQDSCIQGAACTCQTPHKRHHIYVVGTCECERTIEKSLIWSSKAGEVWKESVYVHALTLKVTCTHRYRIMCATSTTDMTWCLVKYGPRHDTLEVHAYNFTYILVRTRGLGHMPTCQ